MLKDKVNIQLITLCLDGNRDSQFTLYNIMLPYLNPICKRYLTDQNNLKDALQDTFINIFRNLHQFDAQKASIRTWAATITINNCLKYNAKTSKRPIEQLIVDIHSTATTPTVFESITVTEVLKHIKQMPPNLYEVFNLFVIDEFSHEEISDILGIKSSLSRKRLSRAREWIKKRTESDSEFHFNLA